jgi:hypothetical protein
MRYSYLAVLYTVLPYDFKNPCSFPPYVKIRGRRQHLGTAGEENELPPSPYLETEGGERRGSGDEAVESRSEDS